jgi:hypothetical protein
MAPGKQDENQLGEDVGVGDVEVVLQRWYRDIAVELFKAWSTINRLFFRSLRGVAHIVLHILLTRHSNALSHLDAHLSSGIVDEATETWAKAPVCGLPRLGMVGISIAVSCLLLLGDWWRRGPHHRYGRNMLGNWMVERR